MKEYKQFFDENDNFIYQTLVNFSLCTKNKVLSLNDLLKLTSDIAVEEYNQRGLSREYLAEHGFAILVSRVSYKIHTMPKENQEIVIKTWEEKPEALQLLRAFEISDTSGNLLVTGLSTWLLVNPEKRTIVPTKMFTLRQIPETQKQHDCIKPGKISVPQDLVELDQRKIRFSDLDSNGHTNNSRYGAFIMDCLPEEYQNKPIKDVRLNYSKEAMLNYNLKISAHIDSDSNKIIVIGEHQEGKCFEAELYY